MLAHENRKHFGVVAPFDVLQKEVLIADEFAGAHHQSCDRRDAGFDE